MVQNFVSQVLLPIVLAFIMFGIGQTLAITDFKQLVQRPATLCLGLGLQMLLLPVLALVIIAALPLSGSQAAGLFLVSLCAGGATSNLFSYLAHGDVALSLVLTALVSMISVFSLPIIFSQYLQHSGSFSANIALPLALTIKQLCLISIVPVILGMLARHYQPVWAARSQMRIKQASIAAMAGIIIALIVLNPAISKNIVSIQAFAALLLSSAALAIAYKISGLFNFDGTSQRTIAIEVGVQNAGTAMVVAMTILQMPELAVVPLTYGLLMNIPAIAFVVFLQRDTKQRLANNVIGS